MTGSGKIPWVPNQPKTPKRSIRITDDLWEAAQVFAAEDDETVSDVIRRDLERYVRRKERQRRRGDSS